MDQLRNFSFTVRLFADTNCSSRIRHERQRLIERNAGGFQDGTQSFIGHSLQISVISLRSRFILPAISSAAAGFRNSTLFIAASSGVKSSSTSA